MSTHTRRPRTSRASRPAAAVLAALLAVPASTAEAGRRRTYNVVILTADALRSDMLGVNGSRRVRTPNLDALAAEGVNFTRAYTSITTTSPSIASLFSSTFPSEHKIDRNTGRLAPEVRTLPQILKERGWHTAGLGNMPWLTPEVSDVTRGITELVPHTRIRKAGEANRWALKFLDSRRGKDKPFFLWVHYTDTHTPYHAPGVHARMYYPKNRDPRSGRYKSMKRVWGLFPRHHRTSKTFRSWLRGVTDALYVSSGYRGSVTYLDGHIGQVIRRLKRNGQWDRTILVFTSDHGESLGEHGLWYVHAGLYEPTARIPLIIRSPRGPKGRSVKRVVSQVDVMPTVLARLGIEPPRQARGGDLWKLTRGKGASGGAALLEYTAGHLTGVVTPRYKYIRHNSDRRIYPAYHFVKGKEELYDLKSDPGEKKDISEKRPWILRKLRALLKELQAGAKSDFPAEKVEVDEDLRRQLRSLGYMQ